MNQFFKHQNLPWLTLLCGGAGYLLGLWLQSTAGEKGFVDIGHISLILLLIFSAVFLALLFWATRALCQGSKYRFNFPASLPGGIGAFAAAAGFAVFSLQQLASADILLLCCGLVGLLAAAALAFIGHCRLRGLRPSMLFHVLICGYLMLLLVCLYRGWSSDPQLTDYCFLLVAIICAMLTAYHRAAFDLNMGSRAHHAFYSLAGIYFCCLSLANPEHMLVSLSLGVWLFTDLCNLTPMPRQKPEASV